MSEEFTIQCPRCGTLYNDLQDVCPYCGEPQPTELIVELPDDYYVDPQPPYQEAQTEPPAGESLSGQGGLPPGHPFADDDIFAVEGDETVSPTYPLPDGEPADDSFGAIGQPDESAPPDELTAEAGFVGPDIPYPADDFETVGPFFDSDFDEEDELEARPRRFKFRRVALGCLGLVVCGLLFYSAIGFMAVRAGLQERTSLAQNESQTHFERGQQLLAENSIDLAVAEFERAVKLNPNFREAREALREAQRLAQLQPTPTSETRTAAAVEIFGQAETMYQNENWAEAAQLLSQVRDLDATYRPERVSEMLFEASYQLGLQQVTPEQVKEALAAFEQALIERPDDPEVLAERNKAALYLKGLADLDSDKLSAVKSFTQLFREDENYLDTRQQLRQAHQVYGDELADESEWCLAEAQYREAYDLRASTALKDRMDNAAARCQDTTPVESSRATGTPRLAAGTTPATPKAGGTSAAVAASRTATTTTAIPADAVATTNAAGRLVYSAYNPNESRWEILAIPAGGGQPQVLATDAIMPALSPNGQILLYRSERQDSIGIHALNLTTGENVRATIFRQHILPRWGSENLPFVFTAQEPGSVRWHVYEGFADGKSDPLVLLDGRTPDWSPDGKNLAYQGTDPEGNQPGIYLRSFAGGEAIRLTANESDRMPAFSPNSDRIAYMSTQNGNWDIFVVSTSGGAPVPVATSPGNDGLPAWSPDGSQLAFVSDMGGSWAIYVIDLAGGKLRKVTDWDGVNRADWLTAQISWGR